MLKDVDDDITNKVNNNDINGNHDIDAMIKFYNDGENSIAKTAKEFNLSPNMISKLLMQNGVKLRSLTPEIVERNQKIIDMYNETEKQLYKLLKSLICIKLLLIKF